MHEALLVQELRPNHFGYSDQRSKPHAKALRPELPMPMKRRDVLSAACAGTFSLSCWGQPEGQDPRELTWVVENFEPYFIQTGPLKGKGIGDRINQFLIDALPEYRHKIAYVPILRITEGLKKGQQQVITTYLKNPADLAFTQYSITSLVVPPLELTLRRQDWQRDWRASPQISLRAFLDAGKVVGLAGRRFYGDGITPIVTDRQRYPKGAYVQQSSHYRKLAEMVVQKHVDATIGYAAELKYFELSSPNAGQLISLPIVEEPNYLYAYVALPKTPWGDRLRERIDRVLSQKRNTPAYRAIMLDWFTPTPAFERAITARFNSSL
ncbi:hypothetical protein DBR47_13800 [Paucibacter sp. KBW04]|nr:hypothetical protein DBR47_13800 [Paucibacter sp. KBW04]